MPGTTAGLVLGVKAQRLAQALNEAPEGSLDGVTPGEYLIPVFDGSGQVTGYERSMDPKRLDVLPKDDHLGRMLGFAQLAPKGVNDKRAPVVAG